MSKNIIISREDIAGLKLIFICGVMTTNQVATKMGRNRRTTRRRHLLLWQNGYLKRCNIASPFGGSPTPVYSLSKDGAQFLAQETGDDLYIAKCQPMPNKQFVPHAVAVTDTYLLLEKAIEQQDEVALDRWINEYEKVNTHEYA